MAFSICGLGETLGGLETAELPTPQQEIFHLVITLPNQCKWPTSPNSNAVCISQISHTYHQRNPSTITLQPPDPKPIPPLRSPRINQDENHRQPTMALLHQITYHFFLIASHALALLELLYLARYLHTALLHKRHPMHTISASPHPLHPCLAALAGLVVHVCFLVANVMIVCREKDFGGLAGWMVWIAGVQIVIALGLLSFVVRDGAMSLAGAWVRRVVARMGALRQAQAAVAGWQWLDRMLSNDEHAGSKAFGWASGDPAAAMVGCSARRRHHRHGVRDGTTAPLA
ncbi:hypothetical protein LTR53_017553 [Teratosphaeriaceae sp. CCFEE 6253]|nr:hypothetical protein LTR53_017553 [Teratosphaeriaceae sp. CCFEE 6253]